MCDCKAAIDKRLAKSNSRIAFGFTFSGNKMGVSPPMIVLEKIDKKKRGKPPIVLATCCPFCGERYDDV